MWHIDAEIISLLFMFAIMFDILLSNTVKTLRNKLFTLLSITTICAIFSDILSSAAMVYYQTAPWWFIQITLLAYFILTPILSMLWQVYAIAVVCKVNELRKKYILITAIPFIFYVIIVLSNPNTGWLFTLSTTNEYARGVLFNSIFLIFYGYSFSTVLLAYFNYKKTERTTSIVLVIFPIIAGLGIWFQQIWPGYLFTGAAFTLVLLITYMFIQNRKVTRDHLTGINSRISFSSMIDKISKSNERGYILTASMDEFKLFNRTFGQKIGDMMLCKIAEYFVSVSPNKTAYRYGGDSFTLISRKSTEQEMQKLADTIMKRFTQSFYMEQIGYSVSVCLGIVEYPCNSADSNQSIISAMDFATYQAKRLGKGQVAFFNESLVKQLKRKHEIADAITKAIVQDTFQVFIQPIYHIKKKHFLFGEALLRLTDSKLGVISPSEFIPIAEQTGKIVEITYIVLDKVCSFLKQNEHTLNDEVSISVNFSVIQFMQSDMVEKVIDIIERHGISPQLIKIEMTESVIADSFDDINLVMKRLYEYGISFALDDYGQGYSNISYLINLPFTFVKLDKSIIDNILTNRRFITALIPMFKSLDKIIISEGVEEKEQADLLEELNCDTIQGYYFAKPMPMNEALELLKKTP